MVEPEKPFACTMPDCGMTFTNEDHLNVHTRKHDMVLQFGCEQKGAVFVADQTPTPTRFIRNCEEVGLFQDLQNVNPFDEGFKRAIETKQGMLSLEGCCAREELHTPQMFPLLDYSATNNTNITISRSLSDETGATKEFETTRISKLTNEVTTISRIVEKNEDTIKNKETQKNSVSYTNNVIKIHSNVEIRKDTDAVKDVCKDAFDKDSTSKDIEKANVSIVSTVDGPPLMSQKSLDFVVDCLTTDYIAEKSAESAVKNTNQQNNTIVAKEIKETEVAKPTDIEVEIRDANKKEDYEVILKLPTGQEIKLVNAEKTYLKPKNTKDLLKKTIKEKVETQKMLNSMTVMPTIAGGTLIPVSIVNTNLVNPTLVTANLANTKLANANILNGKTANLVKANLATTSVGNANLVATNLANTNLVATNLANANLMATNLANANLMASNLANANVGTALLSANLVSYTPKMPIKVFDKKATRRKSSNTSNDTEKKRSREAEESRLRDMECRSAASKRYRARLKQAMIHQDEENRQLKLANERLRAEKALLQALILDHMKRYHCADDLREMKERIDNLSHRNIEE